MQVRDNSGARGLLANNLATSRHRYCHTLDSFGTAEELEGNSISNSHAYLTLRGSHSTFYPNRSYLND